MERIKNLGIVSLILLSSIGCNSNKPEIKLDKNEFENLDTILRRNQENFATVNRANEKSDSSITKKVEKTVKQINNLQAEVKSLKEENNVLKSKIDDANDLGKPFQLLPVSNSENN